MSDFIIHTTPATYGGDATALVSALYLNTNAIISHAYVVLQKISGQSTSMEA